MANFALIWLKLTVFTQVVIFAQTFENHYTIKKKFHIDLDYGKCYFLKLTKRNVLSCLSDCNRDDQCSSCAYSNNSNSQYNCFLYSYYEESNIGDFSGILVNLYSKKCKTALFSYLVMLNFGFFKYAYYQSNFIV